METLEQAQQKVFVEITEDDANVRAEYLQAFTAEAKEFSSVMAKAMVLWLKLHAAAQAEEGRAQVSALAFTAITLHIGSMKLFLSGHTVAAGNLFRQVVETIALSLLCSGKELGVRERFVEDKYSTSDAIRDVLRHAEELGLEKGALLALEQAQKFYSKYSHPSKITVGVGESFAGEGIYVGGSFDPGKAEFYAKEVSGRLGLAKQFPNFIARLEANMGRW